VTLRNWEYKIIEHHCKLKYQQSGIGHCNKTKKLVKKLQETSANFSNLNQKKSTQQKATGFVVSVGSVSGSAVLRISRTASLSAKRCGQLRTGVAAPRWDWVPSIFGWLRPN